MRICFLSTVHTARDKRVFEKEAVSLAEAGHEVVHLCPGDEPETVERGVRVVTYEQAHGLVRRGLGLVSLYRRARALGADCYHCNEVDSWLVGVALKQGRFRRRPRLVFDVHETFPHDLAEFHAPRAVRPLVVAAVRALFRVLVPFTDKLVLAKRSVAVDFPGAEAKQVLVQNFVPLRMLARGGGAAAASVRAPSAAVTAVHVGLISRVRGWPVLVEALASGRAAGVHLKVIGEFNDGSQTAFEARVTELGLQDRVRILGWMAAGDAFREVEQADIGLVMFQPGFRSHTDSLPHKLFDYMLAGLPVIVPDFGMEVAGIVRDAGCGLLVDPSDPDAVATALGTLAGHAAERRRMGDNGRRSVIEKYNWEAEAKRLVGMYAAFEARATPGASERGEGATRPEGADEAASEGACRGVARVTPGASERGEGATRPEGADEAASEGACRGVARATPGASERGEGATRPEGADEAASEGACRGVARATPGASERGEGATRPEGADEAASEGACRGVAGATPGASERGEGATRPEGADEAASEGACRGVRGAKPLGEK